MLTIIKMLDQEVGLYSKYIFCVNSAGLHIILSKDPKNNDMIFHSRNDLSLSNGDKGLSVVVLKSQIPWQKKKKNSIKDISVETSLTP